MTVALIIPGLYVMGGAIAYAMLHTAATAAARREERGLFAFAAMCLFAALTALFAAQALQARSSAQFLRAQKSTLDCVLLAAPAFFAFLSFYVERMGRTRQLACAAYALICLAFLIWNESRPYGLQYAQFQGISHGSLPWGETLVRGVGRDSPVMYLAIVLLYWLFPVGAYELLVLYWRTGRPGALWLLISVACFFPLAVEGALVRLSIIRGFPLGPFGFLIVVAAMGATLAWEAQRKLLASEERFRVLFEHSPDAMVAVEPESGRIVQANAVAQALIGYTAEELSRRTVADLTPADEVTEGMRRFQELASGRVDGHRTERRFVCKGGREIITDCAVAAFKDASGKVARLIACLSDITERKRTEVRMRESEMRLRTLIEQSPVGISFSRDGTTLEVNERYVEMFGYQSAAEVQDTQLLNRIAPQSREVMRQIIERRRAGLEAPLTYEVVGLRKDGSEFPLFVSARRIQVDDGPLTVAFVLDFTERKHFEERVRDLAFFDQLTRLPNRELLQDRLRQAVAASARSGQYGALLLIDLDNFKSINDSMGHAAGDSLLQQVATRLIWEVREGDSVARVGGDEFVVVLEDLGPQAFTAAAQAEAFGLKIMQSLTGPYGLSDEDIHVSCSVGATILEGHRQTPQELLKQANIALHQAKKAGRNTLRFFDPRMQESVNTRAALEVELRKAVETGQFLLHYQVQVDDAGRWMGAEALLRWQHPARGLVLPGHFIALVEETWLILPVGRWVIDAACAQLKRWSEVPRGRDLTVSVNVSPLQFQQPEFAAQVRESLRRHGLEPRRLKLEVTETMLQGDLERTIRTMRTLKEEGVQISLDDFGTGYSSLQYLKRLPLDQLKIDRSFVRDIVADANDKAIVGAIIAMARHLNLEVIAEGVETAEQFAALRRAGCTRYQGFLFGRPVPVESLLELSAGASAHPGPMPLAADP